MNPNTVIRGGAGIYYGLNVATNFQFTGTAFGATNPILFTKDDFQTRTLRLQIPFLPRRVFPSRKDKQYGAAALVGIWQQQ